VVSIIISHHYYFVDLKRQNRLKVGTDKPKPKVKMQPVSDDDDVRKRLLEKPPLSWRRKVYSDLENVTSSGRAFQYNTGDSVSKRSLEQVSHDIIRVMLTLYLPCLINVSGRSTHPAVHRRC